MGIGIAATGGTCGRGPPADITCTFAMGIATTEGPGCGAADEEDATGAKRADPGATRAEPGAMRAEAGRGGKDVGEGRADNVEGSGTPPEAIDSVGMGTDERDDVDGVFGLSCAPLGRVRREGLRPSWRR